MGTSDWAACSSGALQLGSAGAVPIRGHPSPNGCRQGVERAALPGPPFLQAVEGQVNLEKLQQEAHLHNLKRKEVKALYLKVRRGWPRGQGGGAGRGVGQVFGA